MKTEPYYRALLDMLAAKNEEIDKLKTQLNALIKLWNTRPLAPEVDRLRSEVTTLVEVRQRLVRRLHRRFESEQRLRAEIEALQKRVAI
jgi:DNA repair exonuclease SbcCD ATPase subunit